MEADVAARRPEGRRQPVAYCYEDDAASFDFGNMHPMQPHRLRLADALIRGAGVFDHLALMRTELASEDDIREFHSRDYVDLLRTITPDNEAANARRASKSGFDGDCPVFEGMFQFNQIAAGASIGGAAALNAGASDCVVNWQGGFHHARKTGPRGFCYVNDIVLAILELLKCHERVLYIDIDAHHGDGVEEAFLTTDRVMTLSLHHYSPEEGPGFFFPGTGHWAETGFGKGAGYALNAPLPRGMGDAAFFGLFSVVLDQAVERYRPSAVVMQCGADSVAGDLLGPLNLSGMCHAACLARVRSKGLPLLVLGGGGYTIGNVARTWCHETAVLAGRDADVEDAIPATAFDCFFPDRSQLVVRAKEGVISADEGKRQAAFAVDLTAVLVEQLRGLPPAPSVGVGAEPAGDVAGAAGPTLATLASAGPGAAASASSSSSSSSSSAAGWM